MLVIVLLSHVLIYFLMPWAYNYQQEKALETDAKKLGSGAPPRSDGKTDFTIIADTTEDGVKISLAENPYGGADFFRMEQGFAGGGGTITAIVSRQHIEDAVGTARSSWWRAGTSTRRTTMLSLSAQL